MSEKTQYQMRMRKDVTSEFEGTLSGLGTVTNVISYTVTLPNMQAVLDEIAKHEDLQGYEVISIILIHEDNREQLGEDFDWEEV